MPSVKPKQHRALITGLRAILKDSRATVAQRLEAARILATIEGITPYEGRVEISGKSPSTNRAINAKLKSLASEIVTKDATAGITRASDELGQNKSENVAA